MVDSNVSDRRPYWLRTAVRIEAISLAWVLAESVLSGVAAVRVGSLAIAAFSVDSAIELVSGSVLVIRLWTELRSGESGLARAAERGSAGIVSVCLFSLAAFIALRSGQYLAVHQSPGLSQLGLAVAAVSSFLTPWFARRKRQLGLLLHSHALLGDAACSLTCAWMAWTLLAGLLIERLMGWWWVDPVAAVGILYFVTREAWESAQSAWRGQAHVHLH